jgi:hypothetical protein
MTDVHENFEVHANFSEKLIRINYFLSSVRFSSIGVI